MMRYNNKYTTGIAKRLNFKDNRKKIVQRHTLPQMAGDCSLSSVSYIHYVVYVYKAGVYLQRPGHKEPHYSTL